MPTLDLMWGDDLKLTQAGGLALVTGYEEIRQSIIRECLTNARKVLPDNTTIQADYIWDSDYGLNLPFYVDSVVDDDLLKTLEATIKQSIVADSDIDSGFEPEITFIYSKREDLIAIRADFRLKDAQNVSVEFVLGPPLN